MYIVRWLMGHPIIAAWVLGALALLLTLGQEQKNEIVEQNSVIIESSEDTKIAAKKETKLLVTEADKANQDKNDQQNNTNENFSLDNQAATQESVESESVITKAANNTELSTNNGSLIGNSDVSTAKKLSSVSVSTTIAVSTDLESASTDELLQMAREAFWNNGLDEAADLYKKLIEVQPNVIEHKGELGNVYWRQGYPKKAAELYLEIAVPMIESGNSDRVANMIGFIGLFYPKKAADLSNKLQSK